MSDISMTIRNLGPARIAALGAVLVGMLGFFIYLTTRVGGGEMALLYAGLSQTDAGSIVAELEKQQVPYELSPMGDSVKVPAKDVAKLRMQMAQEGLPKGGIMGYELFDKANNFGTTSFVQNINQVRALEGELARTIGTLSNVLSARVHLVMPQRQLFAREQQKATASVVLKLKGAMELGREQVGAIRSLIAAAVPNLEPGQISIIDDRGNLLARAMGDNSEAGMMASQDERRVALEGSLARKVDELLAQTLGQGNVRTEVSVELDFDRITTNSEIYDPDAVVARSTQVSSQNENSSDAAPAGTVGVANNLPSGQASANATSAGSASTRTEETTNFEINRTVRQHVREIGQIRRLSVAVLVDGTYNTAADGAKTYVPRNAEELQQLRGLVASAVNFDEARGDVIEIANLRFDEPPPPVVEEEAQLLGMPRAELMQMAETGILAVVGLLVLLLVVRPLMKRALDTAREIAEQQEKMLAGPDKTAALAPPSGALAQSLAQEEEESELDQMIDISRVEGRVRASTIKKVGEIVDKHPDESVAILRNWIYQELTR